MTKFYFTAVSNSAKKKLVASFEAENEKDARERINKVGMAILSLDVSRPIDCPKSFVFSVTEINGQEFAGEMFEESAEVVFERLEDEFSFKRVNYIFAADASEDEKAYALKNSARELAEKKIKEAERQIDLEKRTLTGSFKSLVTLNFGDKKKSTSAIENAAKYSNADEEDLTKKSEADFPDPNAMPSAVTQAAVSSDLPPSGDEIYALLQGGDPPKEDVDLSEQWQKLKDGFSNFAPDFSKKFGKFYFHITEIIVPSEGKTRLDGWRDMWKFLFPPREQKDIGRIESIKVLKRRARFNRFWIGFSEIVDLLAAVFLGYLVFGTISFYVQIPRISVLAELTLRDNLTIHFLAGTFIFLRILIFLREKFTSWCFWHTALLFLVGSLVIVFAGLNLL
ncbi:MAG: hypothetical protein WCV72_01755 [Patescibacteria group bacterium]